MPSSAREAIAERVESIAIWRAERGQQDMLGLGPEAARRSQRSADGLRALAAHIRALPEDDARVAKLTTLAFSGGTFDPGASMLTELGRFRFHDAEQSIEGFVDWMVSLAEDDASEQGEFGGPQLPGDNPWNASWVLRFRDPDEDEEDW